MTHYRMTLLFPLSLKENHNQGTDQLTSQQLRRLQRLKEKQQLLFDLCSFCLFDDPLEVFDLNVSVDLSCLQASMS